MAPNKQYTFREYMSKLSRPMRGVVFLSPLLCCAGFVLQERNYYLNIKPLVPQAPEYVPSQSEVDTSAKNSDIASKGVSTAGNNVNNPIGLPRTHLFGLKVFPIVGQSPACQNNSILITDKEALNMPGNNNDNISKTQLEIVTGYAV
eukprot:Tbor_TRINITY_DN6193_c4_g4::TRINITY_DN6193_c4_g4_i2::g.21828::m.21828